jgi:hypothetical protein
MLLLYVSSSLYMYTQVPSAAVVSMVAQSDKQLKYLASIKNASNLRVLLFSNGIGDALSAISGEVPIEYKTCSLDYILTTISTISRDLVWLKLPVTAQRSTLVTDNAVRHIQSLHALRVLECTGCAELTELHVSELKALQFLDLHNCENIALLAVNGLQQLQYLSLNSCTGLTTIQGLNELTALKHLNLSYTQTAAATLAGLSELTELQRLSMHGCYSVSSLSQLSTLENLTHLELRKCSQLATLPALGSLVSQVYLDLSECRGITALDVTDLTALQHLNLCHCESLITLTGVSTLTSLQHLDLNECVSLSSAQNFTGLKQLQHLNLYFCYELVDVKGIDTLISLRTLYGCPQLSCSLDFTELKLLSYVRLYRCDVLPSVTGLSSLTSVITLDLRSKTLCLPDTPDVSKLTALRKLEVSSNSVLQHFQKHNLPSLKGLRIHNWEPETVDFSSWTSLTTVRVDRCSNLTTLAGLDTLVVLERLRVEYCSQLITLPRLAALPTLQSLALTGCTSLKNISNKLTDFTQLMHLDVEKCGVGKAIIDSTDIKLVQELAQLQQKPSFYYTDYDGIDRWRTDSVKA